MASEHDRRLAEYERQNAFFGALIGRYANRIANGRFSIGPIEYRVATNNGENHLHGGVSGFNRAVWDAEVTGTELLLSYTSKDGEEGYPATVDCTMEPPSSPVADEKGQCCDPMGAGTGGLPACNAYRIVNAFSAAAIELTDEPSNELQPVCR